MTTNPIAVFIKPWRHLPIAEAIARVAGFGFDGVELPVRDGYPVNPQNVATELPAVERMLAEAGLRICTVATEPTEAILNAVANLADRPPIRDMPKLNEGEHYLAAERRIVERYRMLLPAVRDTGVRIAIQSHEGRFIQNSAGVLRILERIEDAHFGAAWDPAHNALCGESPEVALDLLQDRVFSVNLKNSIWRRVSGPEAVEVQWKRYWTAGNMGLASWSKVAAELKRRGWQGPLVLCAEYADEHSVERLAQADLAYARSLFQ